MTDDVVKLAQELYADSLSAMSDQREQVREDLAFSDPSDPQQWEQTVKAQREGDPGGKRPCLVLDQTGQYVANVAGQVEKQPPSIHAIPVSGGAEKDAAEQIDGRFRHIEYASRASQHYTRSLTSAARTGVGYLVIRPTYVDRKLGWQEPRIGSEADPLKVVYDPWSVETDGSDATSGFILTAVAEAYFKGRWPKRALMDFGDSTSGTQNDARKFVMVAEQWLKEDESTPMIVYTDEHGDEQTTDATPEDFRTQVEMSGAQIEYQRTYTDKKPRVRWRRMSGADVLEEADYPAEWIGIVPLYGYISFAAGRLRYCGIARRARNAQQAYNYHKSELLMPGAQLIASKRSVRGVEPLWDKGQVERRAFLPYNDMDEDGAIERPSLLKVGSSLVDHAAGAAGALRDIQASIGMYQANLGAPSNETSGVAIENRKQQGEASTAHFPSHMSASMGQVGQIVMQMDAKLTDTRRKQPILGVDGTAGSVTVDPEQKQAFQRGPQGVVINPAVGKYGVRVVVGASYSTQRSQTNDAFGAIMRSSKDPQLIATVLPFWAQTLDFPGSDKFAQAVATMAPAPVKAILQPEGADKGPDPAQLARELEQCKQALQEAIEHAKAAQDDADQAIAAVADAKRLGQVKERELDINAYDAETNRLKVTGANDQQIQAIVSDLVNQMLSQPEPLPGDAPPPDDLPPIDAGAAPPELQPPPEPPGPDPVQQALLEGHQHLAQQIQQLAHAISRPRKRTPVRDQSGQILHVIDEPEAALNGN